MRKTRSIYAVHPGVATMQKWISELKDKTGRSLEEWMTLVTKSGPKTTEARRTWLKNEYALGTNACWWIVERAEAKPGTIFDDDPEAYLALAEKYVQDMFAAPRTGLRPVFEKLLKLGLRIGMDAKACPCKTMVPLYRNFVFAQIKPASNSRIDLGFALKDMKPTGRLIDTGGFKKKDRITHRIPISTPAEIDAEVKRWLKVAYDMDA
ncbi:MAG: DUF5655 domain-containing protein [Tepidisphaeraceae bacterium]